MSPRTCVFLLSENRLLREALARILGKRADLAVVGAGRSDEFTINDIAAAGTQILLLDSLTSGAPGFRYIRSVLRSLPSLQAILLGMDDDAAIFLEAVRSGIVGYLLKEASAMEVVAAVRSVAVGEAVCPARLNLTLFQHVSRERERFPIPSSHVQGRLGLTPRQQQLLPLLARGLTNKEIATHLHLSEQTVKNHLHRMMQRVGADGRLDVVEMAKVPDAHA